MTRADLFNAVRPYAPGLRFTNGQVQTIDALADSFGMARAAGDPLTERAALELVCHEAIVPEAYKDSVGVWTWAVGLTKESGNDVLAYKDKPQPIAVCLRAFIDRLRAEYIPDVLKAFRGHSLTEAQFAAALSFHFNTGAILHADWVQSWRDGKPTQARLEFMNWRKPASIIERREKERDLFFDGKWSGDGMSLIYPVSKPSYTPKWSGAKRVDIRADLRAAMGANQ